MKDEEAAEALERFLSAEFIEDDLVEPLIFVFTFMQDMHTFLECGGQLAFVKHKVEIQSCPFFI